MLFFRWSNINEAGVWIFKIGPLGEGQQIQTPKIVTESRKWNVYYNSLYKLKQLYLGFDPWSASDCMSGSTSCHSAAKCVNFQSGFCCQCLPGWYGNGETCLPNGVPQRVTGVISGRINGVDIEQQVMPVQL